MLVVHPTSPTHQTPSATSRAARLSRPPTSRARLLAGAPDVRGPGTATNHNAYISDLGAPTACAAGSSTRRRGPCRRPGEGRPGWRGTVVRNRWGIIRPRGMAQEKKTEALADPPRSGSARPRTCAGGLLGQFFPPQRWRTLDNTSASRTAARYATAAVPAGGLDIPRAGRRARGMDAPGRPTRRRGWAVGDGGDTPLLRQQLGHVRRSIGGQQIPSGDRVAQTDAGGSGPRPWSCSAASTRSRGTRRSTRA